MELRPEQRTTVDSGKTILSRYHLLYMACEMRTGKTFMGITICHELTLITICFITKKSALSGVVSDCQKMGYKFYESDIIKMKGGHPVILVGKNGKFEITITNHEQVTKLTPKFSVYIIDEAHSKLGAFPKPNIFAKEIKNLINKAYVILMSGTPTPESPSQIFHQLWISYYSPFSIFANFYKWAHEYVKQYNVRDGRGKVIKTQVKQKYIGGFSVNDYSEGLEDKIKEITKHYMVFLSQKEAGFTSVVKEEILYVKIDPRLYQLMRVLKKNKAYQMKNGDWLIADSPVKMQSLFHQISSGTVITDKQSLILDESKALFIKSRFAGRKIAIFYKFVAEGELLKKVFPDWTDDQEVFNKYPNKTFIKQIVSGREGTNLWSADDLIMYNIDFSATSYFQGKERSQFKDRKTDARLWWIFSEYGIERAVYKTVVGKKNFTLQYFNQYSDGIGIQTPEKSKTLFEA